MLGEVVDVEVTAVLGGGHGLEISGQDSPGVGIAADHKGLPLGVKNDADTGAGCLPDFDPRQGVAVKRRCRRGAEEPFTLGYRPCQAGQFCRRRGEMYFAVDGVGLEPYGRGSFKLGLHDACEDRSPLTQVHRSNSCCWRCRPIAHGSA